MGKLLYWLRVPAGGLDSYVSFSALDRARQYQRMINDQGGKVSRIVEAYNVTGARRELDMRFSYDKRDWVVR